MHIFSEKESIALDYAKGYEQLRAIHYIINGEWD